MCLSMANKIIGDPVRFSRLRYLSILTLMTISMHHVMEFRNFLVSAPRHLRVQIQCWNRQKQGNHSKYHPPSTSDLSNSYIEYMGSQDDECEICPYAVPPTSSIIPPQQYFVHVRAHSSDDSEAPQATNRRSMARSMAY